MQAARAGGRIGVRPERFAQDLAMDGCPTVDGQEPQDLACPRLDLVQRDSLPSEIEGEPAERPDPDPRPRPALNAPSETADPSTAAAASTSAPGSSASDSSVSSRRRRASGGTSPVSWWTASSSSRYSAARVSSTDASAPYASRRPAGVPVARAVLSAASAASRASGAPMPASASATSPRAHASRTPAPDRRQIAAARSAACTRASAGSEPAHAVTSAWIAAAHGSSTSDGAGSTRGAPGSSSPRIRASRASHASPARSACSPASWSTTTPGGRAAQDLRGAQRDPCDQRGPR